MLAVQVCVLPLLLLAGVRVVHVEAADEASDTETRFIDNGDGTVIDNNTGLSWLKDAYTTRMPLTWSAARLFIQQMNSGERENFGFTNWRLPTVVELESLVDKRHFYPALPEGHPFESVQNDFYWSSSHDIDIIEYAWAVDMASGTKVYDYLSLCTFKFVWPVRSTTEEANLGTVMAAGDNDHGQLGDGGTQDRVALEPVKTLTDAIGIAAGMEHAVAVKADGSVWTWGRNSEGQLGLGGIEDGLRPAIVKNLWKVTDVAAGNHHTFALKDDGTLLAWGRNSYGQLGNGSVKDSPVPVPVQLLTEVTAISSGLYHGIAIRADGTVWTWGWNIYGQLGDGSTENRHVPVQVKNLKNVVAVAAGLHHSVAVTDDGAVWAWGRNTNGILGDGSETDQHTPVRVPGIEDAVAATAGLHHSLALTKDGSVLAWGMNEYGQLGTSSTIKSSPTPRLVEGMDNVIRISSGMYHSVAVLSDGSLWVWGKDLKDRAEKTLPVLIRNVGEVMDIAAGKYFTLTLSGVSPSP